MSDDLRRMIRSILMEELGSRGLAVPEPSQPQTREQRVSIRTDRELAAFVRRLLDMIRDARVRAEIESGALTFRLGGDAGPDGHSHRPAAAAAPVTFDKGPVSEKQIRALEDTVRVIRLRNNVRLTPLAKDAVRQAGIKIERVNT
jgi:pyruvate/2-oxoglutarate dehydrogenase complex dihydrolipoamide acyltransferase (E2) component